MFWKLQANIYTWVIVSSLVRKFSIFRAGIWLFACCTVFWYFPLRNSAPCHVTLRVGGHREATQTYLLVPSHPYPWQDSPPWHFHWKVSWSVALLTTGHCDQNVTQQCRTGDRLHAVPRCTMSSPPQFRVLFQGQVQSHLLCRSLPSPAGAPRSLSFLLCHFVLYSKPYRIILLFVLFYKPHLITPPSYYLHPS